MHAGGIEAERDLHERILLPNFGHDHAEDGTAHQIAEGVRYGRIVHEEDEPGIPIEGRGGLEGD